METSGAVKIRKLDLQPASATMASQCSLGAKVVQCCGRSWPTAPESSSWQGSPVHKYTDFATSYLTDSLIATAVNSTVDAINTAAGAVTTTATTTAVGAITTTTTAAEALTTTTTGALITTTTAAEALTTTTTGALITTTTAAEALTTTTTGALITTTTAAEALTTTMAAGVTMKEWGVSEMCDEYREGQDDAAHLLNVNGNMVVSGHGATDVTTNSMVAGHDATDVTTNTMVSGHEATSFSQGNKQSERVHLIDQTSPSLGGPGTSSLGGLDDPAVPSLEVPASSRLEVPASSHLEVPASSRLEGPASSHLEVPASSRLEVPASSRLEGPASSRLEGPASSRLEVPASSRLEVPASSRLEVPASSRLEVPASSRLEGPASSRLEVPASSRLEGPASSRLEGPASSRLEGPASSRLEGPASSRLEVPASSHLEGPASSHLEGPASSRLEVPASSRLEGPASSHLEGPASSRLEGPASSHLEGPASSRLEGPASSRLEGPASSRLEGPASSRLEGPASSRLEGPASSRLEGPALSSCSPNSEGKKRSKMGHLASPASFCHEGQASSWLEDQVSSWLKGSVSSLLEGSVLQWLEGPAPSHLEGLVPSHLEGPAPSHLEGPAPSQLEGLVPSHLEGPAPSHLEGPAPSQLEGLVPSHLEGPAPSHLEGPAPSQLEGLVLSHLEGPAPLHLEGPAPSHLEGPAPSHLEGPAPSHLEGPAPSHLEGPAPSHLEGPAPSHLEGPAPLHLESPATSHLEGPAPLHLEGPAPLHLEGPASCLEDKVSSHLGDPASRHLRGRAASSCKRNTKVHSSDTFVDSSCEDNSTEADDSDSDWTPCGRNSDTANSSDEYFSDSNEGNKSINKKDKCEKPKKVASQKVPSKNLNLTGPLSTQGKSDAADFSDSGAGKKSTCKNKKDKCAKPKKVASEKVPSKNLNLTRSLSTQDAEFDVHRSLGPFPYNPLWNKRGLSENMASQHSPSDSVQLEKPLAAKRPGTSSDSVQLEKPLTAKKPGTSSDSVQLEKPLAAKRPGTSSDSVQLEKPLAAKRPWTSSDSVQLEKPLAAKRPGTSSDSVQLEEPLAAKRPGTSSDSVQLEEPLTAKRPGTSSDNVQLEKPLAAKRPGTSSDSVQLEKPLAAKRPWTSSDSVQLEEPLAAKRPGTSSDSVQLEKPLTAKRPGTSSDNVQLRTPFTAKRPWTLSDSVQMGKLLTAKRPGTLSDSVQLEKPLAAKRPGTSSDSVQLEKPLAAKRPGTSSDSVQLEKLLAAKRPGTSSDSVQLEKLLAAKRPGTSSDSVQLEKLLAAKRPGTSSDSVQLEKPLTAEDMQVTAAKRSHQTQESIPSTSHKNGSGLCENVASQQSSNNKLHLRDPLIIQDEQFSASNALCESPGSYSCDSHQNLRGFPENILSQHFPCDKAHFKEPLSTEEKQFIILNGPCQPPGPFPPSSLLNGKCFSESYYTVVNKAGVRFPRRWLCYSTASDYAYCEACWLFADAEGESSWITGTSDWYWIESNIKRHESSSHHLQCCMILEQKRLQENLMKNVQEDTRKNAVFWRQVLERIISTTLTLAASYISLGSRKEQGTIFDYHGNFLSIITLLAKHDPVLDKLLRMPGAASKFYSLKLHKDLIDLLSKGIRDEIIKNVNTAPFFSVMMTTTQDLGNTSHLSQVVRYVSVCNDHNGKPLEIQIKESFMGFVSTDGHSAEGLDILKLRGHGYDGTACMSGVYADLQAAINSMQPKADYVHCAAHNLNVVLKDAMSSVPEVKKFFTIIKHVHSFFSQNFSQWHKLAYFSSVSNVALECLYSSSWSSWHDTLLAFRYALADVHKLLSNITLLSKKEEEVSEATVLLSNIEQFQFIFLTVLVTNIFESISSASILLESPRCDLGKAAVLLRTSYTALQETKNKYGSIWEISVGIARMWGVSECFEEFQPPRVDKLNDKLTDSKRSKYSEKWFKVNVFYATLDIASTQTKLRSDSLTHVVSTFKAIQPSVLVSATDDELFAAGEILVRQYEADLSPTLPNQLLAFRSLIKPELGKMSTVLEMASLLMVEKYVLSASFPDICTACTLFLTLPVTVVTCESSLSKLQHINSYLKSVMSQDRLGSLAMLSVENEHGKKLNMSTIIDTLVMLVTRESAAVVYKTVKCPYCSPAPRGGHRRNETSHKRYNPYLNRRREQIDAIEPIPHSSHTGLRRADLTRRHPLPLHQGQPPRRIGGYETISHPGNMMLRIHTHSPAQPLHQDINDTPLCIDLASSSSSSSGENRTIFISDSDSDDSSADRDLDPQASVNSDLLAPSGVIADPAVSPIHLGGGLSPSPTPPSPIPSPPPPLSPSPPPALEIQPQLLDRIDNYNGSYVRLSFSIPEHVNTSPGLYLRTYRDFFINEVQSLFSPRHPFLLIYPDVTLIVRNLNVQQDGEDNLLDPINNDGFPIRGEGQRITLEEVETLIDFWADELTEKISQYLEAKEGYNVLVERLTGFYINCGQIEHPIRLGSHVDYPEGVRGKKLVFNPEGEADICLMQCVAAYKCLAKGMHLDNIRARSVNASWCLRHMKWPADVNSAVTFEDIHKVEKMNKVSIFIYSLERDENAIRQQRHYITLARKGRGGYTDVIPLLMLEAQHLVLIKDFNQYVRNMSNKPDLIPRQHSFCHCCLISLPADSMQSHESTCKVHQTLKFYPPERKITFRNYGRGYGPSHMCFYDFECMLDCSNPKGMIETRHNAVAYAYIIIDRQKNIVEKDTYLGKDAVNHFVTTLEASWARIKKGLVSYELHMSQQQQAIFETKTACELCDVPFNGEDVIKVRHHDHTVRFHNYQAAYCDRCNLQCINSYKFLYTFSHNASYDLGVILNEMRDRPGSEIDILAKDGFKFMKVDVNNLRFLDSLALLNGSLGRIAKDHIDSGKPTTFTLTMLKGVNKAAIPKLLRGKQSFCYDYLSSMSVLDEPQLPSRDKFYNTLKDEELSETDYKQALEIFDLAKCRNIGEYLLLYLKVDTGLLADVFTVWRDTMLALYKLDISHYISLPSFAWDAFLLKSKVQLDVVSDPLLYDLLRRNLRGGFTSVTRQYTNVENRHTGLDLGEDSSYIIYLDFNSLYGACMTELLPRGGIRKLSHDERDVLLERGLENIPCDGSKGYWVLCDTLQVRPEVARYTDELPLVLSHTCITEEHISPYSKNILTEESRGLPKNNTKLIVSHLPQKDYLVSLDLLQLLMRIGLEVAKVHDIYEFEQESYLKDFIETNVRERASTKCAIKKKAFKLVSNSIYGKSLTDVSKYGNKHYLVTDRRHFLKHARNPFFKRSLLLSKDRVICTIKQKSLLVNTPTYLGYHILQIAKRRLYEFWYDVVKPAYGDKASLLYTDTDSFIIKLDCQDVFEELNKSPLFDCMDFSNFNDTHPSYSKAREGELGLLKSEIGSKIINQLIALRPKTYSFTTHDGEHTCKCKGVPYHLQEKLSHDSFQHTLETNTSIRYVSRSIRNVQGKICTCRSTCRGLSAFDDKRYILSPTQSLAYGHPDIPNNNDDDEMDVEVGEEEEMEEVFMEEEEVEQAQRLPNIPSLEQT
ncbi:uncharacterized protein [Procambarus clarkii]